MDPETLAVLEEMHAAYVEDMRPLWEEQDRRDAELAEILTESAESNPIPLDLAESTEIEPDWLEED